MLTGDLPVDKLYDYADETLANRLSVISGVAEIQLSGGEPLELRVTLDKEKLTAAGITVSQVLSKLGEANIKVPVGRIRQGVQEINVTYDSEFKDFNDLGALEIGTREKRRIYLRDVAEITMESEEKRSLAFFDGEPGVVLKVVKKGEANAVRVIDGVRAAVDEINRDKLLPSGMNLVWVRDSGSYIRSSVDDAWSSIAIGILLTAVILFAFLHEARSTFIVVISMPVSIVVSFWAMDLCGFTFNIFTLLALGTSVGTLVTNSIVVIENIARHLERGEDPKTAADSGAAEVALPVFASAMTNVVVFGPIAMMGSLVGRFLVPFAVTIGIATLVSLFVSFTLTPILAAILLRAELPEQNSLAFLFRWWNRGFDALERQFGRSIDFVCRPRACGRAAGGGAFPRFDGLSAGQGRHDFRAGRRPGGIRHQARVPDRLQSGEYSGPHAGGRKACAGIAERAGDLDCGRQGAGGGRPGVGRGLPRRNHGGRQTEKRTEGDARRHARPVPRRA